MTVEGFQALAQRLQQGEPALFPTDTLPALAAIPRGCSGDLAVEAATSR